MRPHNQQSEGERVPILEPKDPKDIEKRASSIILTTRVWDDLEQIVEETGYSRNEVCERFLRWAIEQHRKEATETKRKK